MPGGYKVSDFKIFGACTPGNITDEQIARKRAGFPSKLVPKREEEKA